MADRPKTPATTPPTPDRDRVSPKLVSELRRQGKTAADVWRLLARTLGWYPEDITDAGSFLARFRLSDVPLALQQLQ